VPTTPIVQWDPDSYWYNYANPGTNNDGKNSDFYGPTAYMENTYAYGMGAVYANGLVYVGPRPVRRSNTSGGDVYSIDPDTMVWTRLVNTGAVPIDNLNAPTTSGYSPGIHNGHFGRFNLLELASGKKYLTLAAAVIGPSYMWRIA
jgi:hypothetical protein